MDKIEMEKITRRHSIYKFMGWEWEVGEKKKKHEDQKTGCPVLPSLEDASASKEIRKLEGD